jgi:hypothetical protein
VIKRWYPDQAAVTVPSRSLRPDAIRFLGPLRGIKDRGLTVGGGGLSKLDSTGQLISNPLILLGWQP